MNINDFTEILNKVCVDDVRGVAILKMNRDDTFETAIYGEIDYLEKLGMLETMKHDVLQEPYNSSI